MALNEKQTTNQRGTNMENAIKNFMNYGLTETQARQAILDLDTLYGIIEEKGSMTAEAIIGFYTGVKERKNVENVGAYVKAIVTIANKLYSKNH